MFLQSGELRIKKGNVVGLQKQLYIIILVSC